MFCQQTQTTCSGSESGCVTSSSGLPEQDVLLAQDAGSEGGDGEGEGLLLDLTNYATGYALVRFRDGSHILFSLGSSWQGTPSGTNQGFPQAMVDANGNAITIQQQGNILTFTDTLGRPVVYTSGTGGGPDTVSYKDSGGTSRTTSINYTTYPGSAPLASFQTPAANTGQVAQVFVGATPSAPLLSSVILPNGLSYTFQYNQYGELLEITYPSGGYTRYSYGANPNNKSYYYQQAGEITATYEADGRGVIEKDQCTGVAVAAGATTPSGYAGVSVANTCNIAENKTTYNRPSFIQQNNAAPVVVTDPASDVTKYVFAGNVEASRTIYQGASTLVETVDTCRNPSPTSSNCTNNVSGPQPTGVITTLANGQQNEVLYTYDHAVNSYSVNIPDRGYTISPGVGAETDNLLTKSEYDFGQGSPGPLLRQTTYSYLSTANGNNYTQYPNYILNRLLSETVANGSGVQQAQTTYEYDNYQGGIAASSAVQHGTPLGSYSTSFTIRGNVTATTNWVGNNSPALTTRNFLFDDAGNVLKSLDPVGNATSVSYADAWANAVCAPPNNGKTAAYPTSWTNALGQTTSATYNNCSGTVASSRDVNQQQTSFSYDLMDRRVAANYPDQGQTCLQYSDAANSFCPASSAPSLPIEIVTSTKLSASSTKTTTSVLDGISRKAHWQFNSDPIGTDSVDTTYDSLGRVASKTNRYRSTNDPTYGITTYTYDVLNRPTGLTNPDNTTESWSYTGNVAAFTNERGAVWDRAYDGVGRLTQVKEPDPNDTNTPTIETDYQYDALDDLTRVDQWGGPYGSAGDRARGFNYDGLARLISANNPESGAVSYFYITSGNGLCAGSTSSLCRRQDARGVTTNYSYDALSRLVGKTYQNDPASTPAVSYTYDAPISGWNFIDQASPSWTGVTQTNLVGRLSYESNSNSTLVYGYDQMGRTLLKSVCTPSTCGSDHYDMHFLYDLAGDTTFADRGLDAARNAVSPGAGYYYGGLAFGYNTGAQTQTAVADIADANHPAGILGAMTYNPLGEVATAELGSQYGQVSQYDKRGRMVSRESINLAGETTLADTWGYDGAGNVMNTNDSAEGYFSYVYDNLNRVTSGSGPTYATAYGYDNWGNQTSHTAMYGSTYQWNFTPTGQNQATVPGSSYDAAGNMTSDGNHSYTFDGEGRLLGVTDQGVQYAYDPEGMRVATLTGGGVTAEYLYDLASNLVTTVSNNGSLVRAILRQGGVHWGDYIGSAGSGGVRTEFRLVNQVGTLIGEWRCCRQFRRGVPLWAIWGRATLQPELRLHGNPLHRQAARC